MKKLLIVSLLLVFALGFLTEASADAINARAATKVNFVSALAHPTLGYCNTIDQDGRAYIRDMGGHTIASQWGDGLVYTGECVVHMVIVQSQDADAYAAIYDATSATGTAKADPQSSIAKQVNSVDLKGALFSTGIYIDTEAGTAPNGNTLVTIVYDPL